MSHLVQIKTEVRDPKAISAACQRLCLAPPLQREVKLYSESVFGWAVQLNDWRYPIVCDTDSGETKFDNFNGRWGNQSRLDQFLQAYAVEKTKLEARRRGQSVVERQLDNGSIQLSIAVGGAT